MDNSSTTKWSNSKCSVMVTSKYVSLKIVAKYYKKFQ